MDWSNRIGVRKSFIALGIDAEAISHDSIRTRHEWAAKGFRPKTGEKAVTVSTFKTRQSDKMWPGGWHQPIEIELFHAQQMEPSASAAPGPPEKE